MSEHMFELFDEYAAAYARDERPNAEDFLDRAGAERHQLAALLEEYLRRAPAHAPGEEEQRYLALMLADEPPLLVLRRERKLRREQIVEALRERLGLAPELRDRLGLRYHELETAQLETARVDGRIWETLSELLQAQVDEIATWARPRGLASAEVAFFRTAERGARPASAASQGTPELDEVDRLFGLS